MRLFKKGVPFMDVTSELGNYPVFSEAFLYPKMPKGDARFILGIAEEYEKLIKVFGTERIRDFLEGKNVPKHRRTIRNEK